MKITSELAPLSPCPCSLCCVYKTTLNMINTNVTKRMCSTSLFIYEVLSPSTAALREIRRCRKFIKLLNTQLSYQTLVRKNNRVSILVGSKYATSSPRPYLCSCSRCFVFKTTFNTMPASLTKRKCSTSLFNYEEPFKPVVSQRVNIKWFKKNTVTVALYLGKAVEDEKTYSLSQLHCCLPKKLVPKAAEDETIYLFSQLDCYLYKMFVPEAVDTTFNMMEGFSQTYCSLPRMFSSKAVETTFNYEELFKVVDVPTNVIEVTLFLIPLISFVEDSQPANMKWFKMNTVSQMYCCLSEMFTPKAVETTFQMMEGCLSEY